MTKLECRRKLKCSNDEASSQIVSGFGFRHSFVLRASSFVILFMKLSPEKRIAGVLAPLFGLRGDDDLGIGDVAVLREFVDWTAESGFKLIQLLPINEMGA